MSFSRWAPVSDPLLATGGEVGDTGGQARLGGGGSGGGGAGGCGESCPSSSEELSSVRSITSTLLPMLLSLPLWLDEEALRWSGPADAWHESARRHRLGFEPQRASTAEAPGRAKRTPPSAKHGHHGDSLPGAAVNGGL